MKIYFTAAISQREQFGDSYRRIVKALQVSGHKVQSEHILSQDAGEILQEPDKVKVEYYRKFLGWVNEADVVVAEASFPSTVHIGHEISIALEKGKPVVVLHLKGKTPVFLEGITSDKLFIQEYGLENLEESVIDAIEYAAEQQDTRFNFFISPKQQHYLDWISRHDKTPRAVHLRWLLEHDMVANKAYQADLGKEKQGEKEKSSAKDKS